MVKSTFKYNQEKGIYEVINGKKVIAECATMQEATAIIAAKSSVTTTTPTPEPKKKLADKKEIGFGKWGTPNYILHADTGHMGVKSDK